NLVHTFERFSHQRRIEHRAFKKSGSFQSACRRTNIKNTHAATLPKKSGHQVLPDKAAAARDKRLHHGCRPKLARPWPSQRGCSDKTASRPCRNSSAMKSFATINIGLISM